MVCLRYPIRMFSSIGSITRHSMGTWHISYQSIPKPHERGGRRGYRLVLESCLLYSWLPPNPTLQGRGVPILLWIRTPTLIAGGGVHGSLGGGRITHSGIFRGI